MKNVKKTKPFNLLHELADDVNKNSQMREKTKKLLPRAYRNF
jgi:hypothetical protein